MAGTILIVEDDTELAATLEIALQRLPGVKTRTVHDGKQAMQLLESEAVLPSAVLTDLDLPRVDGFELIRWMRSQAALLHVPVIAMSARGDSREALQAGATRFLAKPYSIGKVREIVKELMNV
jgi:chemosensory pili system protein ChpA (sensor histidine kinase/response regulator)